MAEDSTGSGSGSVFRLIYRSKMTVPADDYRQSVQNILETARRKNPGLGITGALVVWDDNVVQTLEGPESAVRTLYDTIGQDPRHENVQVVETSEGVGRAFSKWSMAQISDFDEADIPLRQSAWEGGIDVHGWRALISPEQQALIEQMRERVQGTSA